MTTATDDAEQAVFRALADPTRRLLLDALFTQDGQTLNDLSARCAPMTRFGVSKHLAVLVSADLVTTLKEGRMVRHYLNPLPIAVISRRWLSKYTAPRADALLDLKAQLEADTATQTTSHTTISEAATTRPGEQEAS